MSKKILFIVDPQVDFTERGSLPVQGGARVIDRIAEFLIDNENKFDMIFVTLDTHNPTNLEFKRNWTGSGINELKEGQPFPIDLLGTDRLRSRFPYTEKKDIIRLKKQVGLMCWPEHCIKGSEGWRIPENLERVLNALGNKVKYLLKGYEDEKTCYSAFHYGDGSVNIGNEIILDIFSETAFYFAGLAKDYCVLETIRSVQKLCLRTVGNYYYLYSNLTAGIRPDIEADKLYAQLSQQVYYI